MIGWPAYLLWGATGGPQYGTSNHFVPVKPFNTALWPGQWARKVRTLYFILYTLDEDETVLTPGRLDGRETRCTLYFCTLYSAVFCTNQSGFKESAFFFALPGACVRFAAEAALSRLSRSASARLLSFMQESNWLAHA